MGSSSQTNQNTSLSYTLDHTLKPCQHECLRNHTGTHRHNYVHTGTHRHTTCMYTHTVKCVPAAVKIFLTAVVERQILRRQSVANPLAMTSVASTVYGIAEYTPFITIDCK